MENYIFIKNQDFIGEWWRSAFYRNDQNGQFQIINFNSFIIKIRKRKMIHEVKITKGERNKKTNNRKKEYNHLTPPKYTDRKSTLNQVNRFEKKFGYDYDLNGQSKILKQMKQEFQNKAVKYLGEKQFTKKQTRFDKMKRKEELGFELKTNPIITKIRRVDKILKRVELQNAFLSLKNY